MAHVAPRRQVVGNRLTVRFNDHNINQVNVHLANALREVDPQWRKEPLSQMASVIDLDRESVSLVLVHEIHGGVDKEIVKFSEPKYAPSPDRYLKLAKPAYYRDEECLVAGIRDPEDGTQIMDATPYMSQTIPVELSSGMIRNLSAQFTLRSDNAPWVYCTSIRPNSQIEYSKLKQLFDDDYKYSAVTKIQDPSAFALQLGLDFVLMDDSSEHVEVDIIAAWGYERASAKCSLWDGPRSINRIVHVYHGPVSYQDQSGVLQDLNDFRRLPDGIYATFTKRAKYRNQVEYRFAISPLGIAKRDTLLLPVSEELYKLVVPES
ncbi:MAG: hypothetical protein F4065_02010 [Rhodothermaceae bacterium]|nr:hypothetical protein [Bacteroidota bacterium]MXX96688.1 hypothetical protein [Rhodothermaceae bacterium]MXZ57384.1 hypothetical protein [Rhodothermaceae bacterium]MYB90577.1 hypothetical protein [Rhodothermaceae bacterium]MYD68325.1 hypothetical protein [Rhodothermaceae bacterium]